MSCANFAQLNTVNSIRQFNLWSKAEFDWSWRTAYNFIYIYEAFPESMRAKFAGKIYAGDPSLDRCEQAVTKLGVDPRQVDRIHW